jgi:aconitate hydratase
MPSIPFDIDMLRSFYAQYAQKVELVKSTLNKPLTLTEKILYSHLHSDSPLQNYHAGRHCPDGFIAIYDLW